MDILFLSFPNCFISASNEPSAVLARAFGECREVFDCHIYLHILA